MKIDTTYSVKTASRLNGLRMLIAKNALSNKSASRDNASVGMDWAAAIDKQTTMAAIDNIPNFNPHQKSFLNTGFAISPTTPYGTTTVPELQNGFASAVQGIVGNLVPAGIRYLEGHLIGGAFAGLAGLPPGTTKWVKRLTGAADALMGNRLFQSIK